jgi:hypothetical protein
MSCAKEGPFSSTAVTRRSDCLDPIPGSDLNRSSRCLRVFIELLNAAKIVILNLEERCFFAVKVQIDTTGRSVSVFFDK